MDNFENLMSDLSKIALECGATNASVISADKLVLDKVFRDMCAANYCGMYGKCWTCPPDVGEIEELMEKVRSF